MFFKECYCVRWAFLIGKCVGLGLHTLTITYIFVLDLISRFDNTDLLFYIYICCILLLGGHFLPKLLHTIILLNWTSVSCAKTRSDYCNPYLYKIVYMDHMKISFLHQNLIQSMKRLQLYFQYFWNWKSHFSLGFLFLF